MVEAFGVSDPGCIRNNNEDYYLIAPTLGLYLVADGMGGAQAGERASKLAADTVAEVVYRSGHVDAGILLSAFEEANSRVMSAAASDSSLEGMGTTLVGALAMGDEVVVASVGDSRAYVYEQGQLLVVTRDQTWVEEVGRRLGIEESALRTHPMRHMLTMAIGIAGSLRIHSYRLLPADGAQILLCSDGLHGVLESERIAGLLANGGTLEQKCYRLIEAARAAGGPDNITTVLLRYEKDPPSMMEPAESED
jgi:PPM family protein phosphatase